VVLAAAVFHESLARSPWQLALQLAGAATAVTGIALLSHSCVVLAEDRRQSGLAAAAAKATSHLEQAPCAQPAQQARIRRRTWRGPLSRLSSHRPYTPQPLVHRPCSHYWHGPGGHPVTARADRPARRGTYAPPHTGTRAHIS
jgi:hypothetical protein